MSKKIIRTPFYYGTKHDLELVLRGMKPISGIKGVNETFYSWFIHPQSCNIVHIVRVDHNPPFEDRYVWTMTIYDPNAKTGFSSSGRKIVRLGEKTYYLARVVAATFVETDNPQENKIVVHKNGNQRDCRASNLAWMSKKELSDYRKNHRPLKLNLKPKILNNNIG